MTTGVVLLNFGEPSTPERGPVVEYLTRIFMNNADLEEYDSREDAMERSRELAQRRAAGLIEEYEEIGGSPLNEQSETQADGLSAELDERDIDVEVYTAYQFTEPLIEDTAEQAHEDGIDHLVGLPVYPLCGASTNVAANDDLEAAIDGIDGWDPEFDPITGWHKHPTYNRIRAENVESFLAAHDVDPNAGGTRFVFSAHGTPTHYLEEGSRYDIYVDEHCRTITSLVGIDEYELGFQNHQNRNIEWTQPEVEDVIEELGDEDDVERVVVEPMSFMHEQSETLSELDDELAEEAAEVGLEFHRVPVPHDDERFPSVLADLVEPFATEFDPEYYQFRQCQCRDVPGTMCLNAPRE